MHCIVLVKQVPDVSNIPLTATSGEGLTSFGKGEGIQAVSIVTAERVSK